MIRLGYHYHTPALLRDKRIITHGAQGLFLDSLAPFCEKIVCFLHTPRVNEDYECNYEVQSDNIELVNIGPHASVPVRVWRSKQYCSLLEGRQRDIDVILLRGPSPLLPAMARAIPSIPRVLLLVASYHAGIDSLAQPWWRKELIRLWAGWNESQQLKIAKKSLTFVNSRLLFNELRSEVPDLLETKTTTISEKDFFDRNDTCLREDIHLLFSGRITAEKGLSDILLALKLVRMEGYNCYLDLVGNPENNNYLKELFLQADEYGLENFVVYHGFKTIGSELLSYYRIADIFILGSKSSFEGFPRTIWEAFSQGVPVIATSVGSIPYFLKNEVHALISPPNAPQELANRIKKLINQPELRQRLIKNGADLVGENTLEIRAKEMMTNINRWVIDNKEFR